MKTRIIALDEYNVVDYQPFYTHNRYSVHLTPEWLEVFSMGDPQTLMLAVYTQVGDLCGLLPLSVKITRGTRFWGIHKYHPIAQGPSDFYYPLAMPGYEAAVAQSLAKWFQEHPLTWDFLALNNIPASSGVWELFVQYLTEFGFKPAVDRSGAYYKINTTQPWETYEKTFLHKKLADLRNRQNRLKREKIELKLTIFDKNIDRYLNKFFDIYHQRRLYTHQNSAIDKPDMYMLLRQAIQAYEQNGWVRFSVLEDNSSNHWAYQLDWVHNHVWYHYMPAYDMKYADYSPGKILLYEVIKHCFDDPEIDEFNFMRGESDYKLQFANQFENYVAIQVENPRSVRLRMTRTATRAVGLRKKILGR